MKKTALLVALAGIALGAAARDARPNIVLLISDQHSGKITTQAGYPYLKTPGMDKLASEGVSFTRSYCTYPVCVASRASIMTGRMPNKAHSDLTAFPAIGARMKNAGYETVYFGRWHVSNSEIDEVAAWHGFQTWKEEKNDTFTTEHAVEYLTGKHKQPFFMVVSYMNPHDCCELARNIAGLGDNYHDGPVEENMDPAQCPPLPANFGIPPDEAEGFSIRRNPDPETERRYFRKHPVKYWGETEWRQYMYGYDRLVEKVDAHILNVVNTLEEQGLLENTLIIYTSDHGDGHASHQWNQKKTFYEESINVPFIVSWKGKTRPDAVDSKTLISSGLDIYPTLCSAAGIEHPESLQGRDVSLYAFRNPAEPAASRDYVVSEMTQRFRGKTFTGRMVVNARYKYILFDSGENREQLFDLQEDPGEMQPVTGKRQYSDQLEASRQQLRDWIVNTADSFPLDSIPQ